MAAHDRAQRGRSATIAMENYWICESLIALRNH